MIAETVRSFVPPRRRVLRSPANSTVRLWAGELQAEALARPLRVRQRRQRVGRLAAAPFRRLQVRGLGRPVHAVPPRALAARDGAGHVHRNRAGRKTSREDIVQIGLALACVHDRIAVRAQGGEERALQPRPHRPCCLLQAILRAPICNGDALGARQIEKASLVPVISVHVAQHSRAVSSE